MRSKQPTIPGLEPPVTPLKAPTPNSYKKRIGVLEARVLNLELEITLLTIQMKAGKDHA